MSNLRNKVIRLAHRKPELREHLLPLLKESAPSNVKSPLSSFSIEGYFDSPEILEKAHTTLLRKRLLQNEHNWNDSGSQTGSFAFAVEPKNIFKVERLISMLKGTIVSKRMYDSEGREKYAKIGGRLEDYDFLGEILNLKRYAYGENGVFIDEGKYTLRQLQQILKKNRLTHLKIEENGYRGGWHIH